ncbi:hypothetical protein GCM10023091_14110 [Ravibacter arvi]|uniref:Haem-binding domain-containing protein n=1 Tax=Ravibacter arvi TaxID=2051041 RepID=A0ABP8LV46_9BACT
MFKKIAAVLLIALIIIQFIRPEKNLSDDRTHAIGTRYAVPDDVNRILESACNDCHSNKTNYPWYAGIQPVAWWLDHHVTEGKGELNFSAFTKLSVAVQNHKFEEIIDEVKEKKMPLPSYTQFGLHPDAHLTDVQRERLVSWAQDQMRLLKSQYPEDSLKMKR